MGCTPSSLHVHQSGSVKCGSKEDLDASGHSQPLGVQGSFKAMPDDPDPGEGANGPNKIPEEGHQNEACGEGTGNQNNNSVEGTNTKPDPCKGTRTKSYPAKSKRTEPDPGEGTSYQNMDPLDPMAIVEDRLRGSIYFQSLDRQENQKELKFESMRLRIPSIRTLLVFPKEDAQSDALKWAAEKLSSECTICYTSEEAEETYQSIHPQLVFIDSRQSKTFDAAALCRTLHSFQGSHYTCIVAVVKKSVVDKDDESIVSFLQSGFTRWFVENHHHGHCLNELIQMHHTDISYLFKLRATTTLFSALDGCREGVIVTNMEHRIQYVNKAFEKFWGCPAADLYGKNAMTLCRGESVKADIPESINMQVKKGKDWEGTLFHKRKSGENLPLWSRVQSIEIFPGVPEYLVHVNDCPVHERSMSSETTSSDLLPLVKSQRKSSVDVRSFSGETGLNRRQSFAKFHPMTIEPPITKVINMILATQEHSPLFVVQALDRVLDMLRSTDIYSPQFVRPNNHAEDAVASDLFSGLISNSKQVIRRFSHEAFKGAAGQSGQLPPTTPSSVPTLANAPEPIREVLENVNEFYFDVFLLERISEKRPLIWVGMALFAQFNACALLNCDESVLRNWLSLIESNYHENPYHNSTHAADVLQATAYFMQKPRLKAIFDPIDEVVSLIAAAVHDIDHPGRNSAFLCNSGSELAILYNDLTVLESHHSALAFKLTMSSEKVNIFHNLNKDSYKEMRRSIIDMVLATEMTRHFEHLSKFVNVFTKSVEEEEVKKKEEEEAKDSANDPEKDSEEVDPSLNLTTMNSAENIVLVKRILIKCADVSNPARPLDSCIEWAHRIAEEYMSQTDEERSKNLPIVMPAFDRATCSIPKSQIGFVDYFVNDMFDAWDAFCEVPELMDNIRANYEYWRTLEVSQNEADLKAKEEDLEALEQIGDPDS